MDYFYTAKSKQNSDLLKTFLTAHNLQIKSNQLTLSSDFPYKMLKNKICLDDSTPNTNQIFPFLTSGKQKNTIQLSHILANI